MVALLMHLVPTAIILVILAVSWRWEWVGGVLFIALGILYIVLTPGSMHWPAYLFISGPLFLVGVLFWLGWIYRAEIRKPQGATNS